MPVFNGGRFLRESIESVLRQTFSDFEFLIVNDGSTDSSRDIILSYDDPRLRLIENSKNLGVTKSLNRGLELAQGDFVARQDADDISHPKRFEKQLAYLNEHPEVAVLGSEARYVDEHGRQLQSFLWSRPLSEMSIRWTCMFESPFIHSSVMVRSNILKDKCGGYDSNYLKSQDHELWTRIVYDHVCRNLPEPLIEFRIHSHSLSSNFTIENIESFVATHNRAIQFGLGRPAPQGWADLWTRVNNPCLYSRELDVGRIAKSIDEMYAEFVRYNSARLDDEILLHRNRLLIRTAYQAVGFSRTASLRLFSKTALRDPRIASRVLPKYLIKFLFNQTFCRHLESLIKNKKWPVFRSRMKETGFEHY
jgi:glycosyltransferase involved in cell wall biosynthesis